ncbi:DNA-processing protein DprA [Actinomyces sp. B33]|uniref:DNA-processing protein DprA n=1 Tax=Actinomyces sp. B33 TaxID=2942131 RepID=UPI00233FDD9D|nr:DNA-processing protein DprA [Actinomyces sp. B33]MDC4232959.1 DNA-processing protein DprA [Actinomyces sp. B33]
MGICDEATRRAAWWTGIIEPDDPYAHALRLALGDERARRWAQAPEPGPLPDSLTGPGRDWAGAWARWHPRCSGWDVDAELEGAERRGIRVVARDDPEWPEALDLLGAHAPAALWVRGRIPRRPSVSIVGARAATQAGIRTARDLAFELSDRGRVVVSGGAFGIDIAAHRGALDAGAPTVAVMAGGLANPYPKAHVDDFTRIVDSGGALVSEVPPSWRPAAWRFLGRNRVIAAWGAGTVVVEAGERSGALATARRALDLGRPVGAVPGPLSSHASKGCHALMRNGAELIRDADDVVEMIDPIGAGAQGALFSSPVEEDHGAHALEAGQRRVWEALPVRARAGLSALARSSGLSEREVLVALAGLELAGWVVSDSSGWRRRRVA